MIHLDYLEPEDSVAALPTVCMHCSDPVAPCAEVCPADAILVDDEGVVLSAQKDRCIACSNCVHACPFGVPKVDVVEALQYKCDLCYDRTSQGRAPMCATVCPTDALFYASYAELLAAAPPRRGRRRVRLRRRHAADGRRHGGARRRRPRTRVPGGWT